MAEYIERRIASNKLYDVYEYVKRNIIAYGKPVDASLVKNIMLRFEKALNMVPNADVAPVRHGRWILEAHDERVNYRWNVTAECSECCDERKEIWAGFFPSVPPSIARGAALVSAENVKLSNYCPNCGAKMDGGEP